MADIPVKCTRCRHDCMASQWVDVPSKKFRGATEKTCPKCGCRSYYDMRLQVAWCWATGLIEIGDKLPETEADGSGAILIARGPKSQMKAVLGVLARHGYQGELLVPGVPEAESANAQVDALTAWTNWCAKGNGKKGRYGVEFIKEL